MYFSGSGISLYCCNRGGELKGCLRLCAAALQRRRLRGGMGFICSCTAQIAKSTLFSSVSRPPASPRRSKHSPPTQQARAQAPRAACTFHRRSQRLIAAKATSLRHSPPLAAAAAARRHGLVLEPDRLSGGWRGLPGAQPPRQGKQHQPANASEGVGCRFWLCVRAAAPCPCCSLLPPLSQPAPCLQVERAGAGAAVAG